MRKRNIPALVRKRVPWRRAILFLAAIMLLFSGLPAHKTQALANGDGVIVYGENAASTPRWRSWTNNGSSWSAEQSLPTASDNIHQIQTATAPTRYEAIAAVQNANLSSPLKVYHFDGSTWTLDWTVNVGFNTSAPRFDVAYSQTTGKGFVVYSGNTGTTNELRYRTFDGSTWSAEQNYDAVRTSGTIAFVKALARPGTDEIAVEWADDSNMDLSANYFNMASGTWSGEPAAALSTAISRNGIGLSVNTEFSDMAFEQVSGDLVLCWGDNNVTDLKCVTRSAGTGGSWGSTTTYSTFAIEPVEMHMSSEPGTDYIAYTAVNDAGTPSGEVGIWDGSTWGNISAYDASLNSADASTTNTSVGWLKSGGQSRAVVTFDDQLTTGIDWLVFNKNTPGWATQTAVASPAMSNFNDRAHTMRMNPFNNAEAMVFIYDNNNDLFSRKVSFDGSSITWTSVEPGGTPMEQDMVARGNGYGWSFDFQYYNFTKAIDSTAGEFGTYHDGTSPTTVFVSDQVGYTFYRNRTQECGYAKTTDGGQSWSAPVQVLQSACLHVAIWYDRWTPGDNTGNYIYITGWVRTADKLNYNRLDTTNDSLLSATGIPITTSPGPAFTNTITGNDNYPSIAKSTTGVLYMGAHDSGTAGDQSFIIKCSSSCDLPASWSDTSAGLAADPTALAKNYALLLEPLASGDMMALVGDQTNNDILSKVYHSGTSSWDGAFTTIDANASYNSAYAGDNLSAVVDKTDNKIYLAYTADAATLGTDDDFRTAVYNGSSWTAKTDILTNSSMGLILPQLAMDENTGDIYAGYLALTTPATPATTNVYWKKSTDGMTTWGSQSSAVNVAPNALYGLRLNVMSKERIYAAWTDAATESTDPRSLNGDTIADLTPPTYDQTSYRLFNNANSTDVGSALAASNTAATLAASGNAFRLRMVLTNTGGVRANGELFKLQYAGKGAGTCAVPSGTPATYTDVTTSTRIAYKDNATPADGAALTANANDPTHDVNQSYEEANDFTLLNAQTTGQKGMWDFALYDNGTTADTYCLRAVKNDGTVLTTYTQRPEISTVSANTAPNSATSLAQSKTDNTVLNTGDWTSENSVKFSASVSDPDSTDTLQLCVEKKPIGSAFTNTEDSCGTGVAYSGTPVSATVTIGSLVDGTEYHWQARVKDAGGLYSSWVSYGGNAESARDVGVDTSAPTGGTVYDGTSAGVDSTFNDNSLSSLSANWSGFNAGASGLARYDYSIGTTAGGTDVKGWTSNGTATSVTSTGLTLQTSQMYYINVRAVDNAGNVQSAVSSDGQMVLPSLSFGVSSHSVAFNNLNASNSYTDTQSNTLTTSTNAYGGYILRAFSTGVLQSGSFTIGDFNGGSYAAPDSWQSGDIGFGYTSSDTSVQGSNIFQAATCPGGSGIVAPGCYAPFAHTGPGDIVADHTANVTGSPISNEAFTISYRVTASATQQASPSYTTTIIYSATPKY